MIAGQLYYYNLISIKIDCCFKLGFYMIDNFKRTLSRNTSKISTCANPYNSLNDVLNYEARLLGLTAPEFHGP